MKTMMITPDLLRKWDACKDGYKWALPIIGDGIELSAFLPEFDRADWMLWTLNKSEALDKAGFIRLAAICAETVLDIYERRYPDDKRPRKAIEAAIKYAENPTQENRDAAAYAAHAAADAADAAADAAHAATYAADAAADAAHAAYAAYAAGGAAHAAREEHHKKMCALIRAQIDKWESKP